MGEQPNVLCLSIDSLRADVASFVSGGETTTPFLDEFAREATVCESAIAPSIWTLPVHTSVFTGLYPLEHNLLESGVVLGDHPTFAELLAAEGYETGAFYTAGWFDQGDMLRGFESRNVREEREQESRLDKRRIKDLLGTISPTLREVVRAVYNHLNVVYRGNQNDATTVDRAAEWHADVEEPFCSFVHFTDVHWPYRTALGHLRQFVDAGHLELFWNRVYWQRKLYNEREAIWAGELQPPEAQLDLLRDIYRACVYATDRLVEDLLSSLAATGKLENTIVVVFGDHGDLFGEDDILGHQYSLADPLIRVPMLVRDPTGQLGPGRRSHPTQLNDVYPTVLDICDVEYPETHSVSLLEDDRREYAYVHYRSRERAEEFDRDAFPPDEQFCVWRSPEEKLLWYPETDTYAGPAAEDEALRTALRKHLGGLADVPAKGESDIEESVRRNLEDLGYM